MGKSSWGPWRAENVAVATAVRETYVDPFVGVTPVTVGGGGGSRVVNAHENVVARGVPSLARIDVDSVAVYCVEYASGLDGVSVAVWLARS